MNSTTKKQAMRLLACGWPEITVTMVGHAVVAEPVALGRLWDAAHQLKLQYDFPTYLTSNELIEELVKAIEKYYYEKA